MEAGTWICKVAMRSYPDSKPPNLHELKKPGEFFKTDIIPKTWRFLEELDGLYLFLHFEPIGIRGTGVNRAIPT